jgi:GTP-binding protein
MFRITTSEFIIGAAQPSQFPRTSYPEIAFAGRSNVGKSSLLNALTGRRKLAKVSGTPGKTRQINFFRINERCHFVDLPGYGYARVAKSEREEWSRVIEQFIREREQLRLVVALSDIRHEPTALDRDMFAWLEELGRPFVVVLTKYDKVSRAQADERVEQVRTLLAGWSHCVAVIPFSSETRHNLDRLLGVIGSALR